MAQQAQKLLVRRGQSNNATPRASATPRDTPNGSRRQSMGAGYRRDSTAGQGEKDTSDAQPDACLICISREACKMLLMAVGAGV